jgi:hypothetical protein
MTSDIYSRADCKAGLVHASVQADDRSFVNAYQASLRLQDALAQNRLRFAQRLSEMSDELVVLAKEGERLRKMVRLNVTRDLIPSTRTTAPGTSVICKRAK